MAPCAFLPIYIPVPSAEWLNLIFLLILDIPWCNTLKWIMSSVCKPRDHSVNFETKRKEKRGSELSQIRREYKSEKEMHWQKERRACERKWGWEKHREGKWARGQIYQTISRSHIKEKAHLKQQALWGITHSSASLSHQAQSEHENLQHTDKTSHCCYCRLQTWRIRGSAFYLQTPPTSKKETWNKQNWNSSETKTSNQW